MVLLMTCTLKVRIFRKVLAIFVSLKRFTVHYFAYQAIDLSGIKLLKGQGKISYLWWCAPDISNYVSVWLG